MAGFAALVLCGAAVAQVPPPPPPPAPVTTAGQGVITKMSFDDLRAVYDAAGVPYETLTTTDGAAYLAAAPEGFRMFALLAGCPDPAKSIDCEAIILESGAWDRDVTAADLAVFNGHKYLAKAFFNQGKPAISYTYVLTPGVAPEYIRSSLRNFVIMMKGFGAFDWVPGAQPQDKPAGSFSAPALDPAVKLELNTSDLPPSGH